jgi:hypothetical protein
MEKHCIFDSPQTLPQCKKNQELRPPSLFRKTAEKKDFEQKKNHNYIVPSA